MNSIISTGEIPFYGAVNNGAKSIKSTIKQYDYTMATKYQFRGINTYFTYVPNWTMSLGGRNVNFIIDDSCIKFYTTYVDDSLSYRDAQFSSATEDSTITGFIYRHSNEVYNLNWSMESIYFPKCNIYLKDTGDMLFIRVEGTHTQELIITNDGYIQIKTTYDNYYCYGTKTHVKPITFSYYSEGTGCSICHYNSKCSHNDPGRTSCYYELSDLYDSSYKETKDMQYNYNGLSEDYISSKGIYGILLKPSTTLGDYNFTAVENEYISNTGLTPISGEIKIYTNRTDYSSSDYSYYSLLGDGTEYHYVEPMSYKHCRSIPLFNTIDSSKLNIGVRANGVTQYLRLSKNSSMPTITDTAFKDKLINISYANEIYSNTINRTPAKNVECFYNVWHNMRTVSKVYTQGNSLSTPNAYWNNVPSVSFSNRPFVSSVLVVFKFEPSNTQGDISYPNSSVNQIRFYYNTSSDDMTSDISTRNCNWKDISLSAPYYNYVFLNVPINNYLKQFVLIPIISHNNISSNITYSLNIKSVVLNMYNDSNDSFTYTM